MNGFHHQNRECHCLFGRRFRNASVFLFRIVLGIAACALPSSAVAQAVGGGVNPPGAKPANSDWALISELELAGPADRLRCAPVPRADCFPIERLPADLRPDAEKLLLQMLDTEALYTLIGGLKPMSSAFWQSQFTMESPDLTKLERTRRLLSIVRCGDAFTADVLVFREPHQGKRFIHGVVTFRPGLSLAVAKHPKLFAPMGVTPTATPWETVLRVEFADKWDRLRGYGYLYGYPDDAVDFFITAETERATSGTHVPRSFFQAPTYKSATGRFVWAVPVDHRATREELGIVRRAERILATYIHKRRHYIGPDKPGVVALLRDWFDNGQGMCSPEYVRTDLRHLPTLGVLPLWIGVRAQGVGF